MSDFWNARFDTEDYVYGTEPNQFFKYQLQKLKPGKILFPAEGEGRNAVYAAKMGWEVYAFDSSSQARIKALKLAKKNNVIIQYEIDDFENIKFPENDFDCIVLLFAHFHPGKRNQYHKKSLSFLKPGGNLILKGFSKKQINHLTGGPRNIELLFSKEELLFDFKPLSEINIEESDMLLNEGVFHQGTASVITLTGIK